RLAALRELVEMALQALAPFAAFAGGGAILFDIGPAFALQAVALAEMTFAAHRMADAAHRMAVAAGKSQAEHAGKNEHRDSHRSLKPSAAPFPSLATRIMDGRLRPAQSGRAVGDKFKWYFKAIGGAFVLLRPGRAG